MIPQLVHLPNSPWMVLPPGIHAASLIEIRDSFATNAWRRDLFRGLVVAAAKLRSAGCSQVYLDGSYVTGKPRPRDFDACWDPSGVDRKKLDDVFLELGNGRAAQKKRFKGEFFPASPTGQNVSSAILEFFQKDRFSGRRKGILLIPLRRDPLLLRGRKP